jgi:hypothetical protein
MSDLGGEVLNAVVYQRDRVTLLKSILCSEPDS